MKKNIEFTIEAHEGGFIRREVESVFINIYLLKSLDQKFDWNSTFNTHRNDQVADHSLQKTKACSKFKRRSFEKVDFFEPSEL